MAIPFLKPASTYKWHFFRAGGFDQVRLTSGADILNLDKLDQKLWVALACPTRGLEFDSKTLDLIDTDRDGRIRVPEIIAAARWAGGLLKNADDLTKGSASLPLGAINDGQPEGRQLLASARQILKDLGKGDAAEITLEDTADTAKIFAQTKFNGDGIIPADSATDPATQAVIADLIACLGPVTDRSGKPGINQGKVDQFFAEAQAFSDWWQKAEREAATVLPLGEATPAAVAACKAVKAKVDDYFARCRLAAFDARAVGALNRPESDYAAVAAKELSSGVTEVAAFPLARIEAGRPLPLTEGLNPAWAAAITQLQRQVIEPLLGARTVLTEADWAAVTARFAGHEGWLASKTGTAVEKLGLARVREILAGGSRQAIADLIAQDKALEPEANAIAQVDKLIRYHRDLFKLLNNFVSFHDFYAADDKAIFQAGTLYLDGRSCDLCVRVEDMGKHGALAGLSRCYLAYCDCTRKGAAPEKMTVVAAFTDGDSDFLMVGRNGVFYDRKGQDWDATITKVIEQPISIRQAFWSPYKRVAKMVEDQIEKFASARDKEITAKAAAGVADAGKKVEEAKPAAPAAAAPVTPQQAFDVAKFAGIFAAIGLAIGAIGGAITAVAKGFFGLAMWQMPLAIGGALLVISGPAMLLAYMKLRQRNIGPVLEANGWAVNARAKINVPFGGSLTAIATLPEGADRSITDPFAQKQSARPFIYALLVALYIMLGMSYDNGNLHAWTNGLVGKPATEDKKPDTGTPAPTNAPPAAATAPAN